MLKKLKGLSAFLLIPVLFISLLAPLQREAAQETQKKEEQETNIEINEYTDLAATWYSANPYGTNTIDQVLGTTRSKIISWLESHEHDGYYIGTPYEYVESNYSHWNEAYCTRPRGEYSVNPILNCTGFVSHVFLKCGAYLKNIAPWVRSHTGYSAIGGYINAYSWYLYIMNTKQSLNIRSYSFNSITEALNSGKLQKGDLIYFEPSWGSSYDKYGNITDCHIGFFWGDTSRENKFWHSSIPAKGVEGSSSMVYGNQISRISPPCAGCRVYVFPLSPAPDQPSQLKASGSSNGITVSWKRVGGAAGYKVYRKTAGGKWKGIATLNSGYTVSYKDKTAELATEYYYTVRAFDAKGSLSTYNKSGIKGQIAPVLKTTAGSSRGITVSWEKVSGATAYRVYRKVSGGNWKGIVTVSAATTSYQDKPSDLGTVYLYTVRAYNSKSNLSGYDKSGIKGQIAPTLQETENTSEGITVSWEKVSGATAYRVYRKVSGGNWKGIVTVSAATASYQDKPSDFATAYLYTVRAYNAKSELSDYNKSGVKGQIAPTLQETENTSEGITVSWEKVSGATAYRVYRKVSGGNWKGIVTVSAATTSYQDKPSDFGTAYLYTVRAYDRYNRLSDYNKSGIKGQTAPTLHETETDPEGITVSWDPVSDAKAYRVYRKLPGGNWKGIVTVDATVTSYLDSAAETDVQYLYTVRAYDRYNRLSGYDKNGVSGIRKPTVPEPEEPEEPDEPEEPSGPEEPEKPSEPGTSEDRQGIAVFS